MRREVTRQIESVSDPSAPTASWDDQIRISVAREIMVGIDVSGIEGDDAQFVQLCAIVLVDILSKMPMIEPEVCAWLAGVNPAPESSPELGGRSLFLLVGFAKLSNGCTQAIQGCHALVAALESQPLSDDESILLQGAKAATTR